MRQPRNESVSVALGEAAGVDGLFREQTELVTPCGANFVDDGNHVAILARASLLT